MNKTSSIRFLTRSASSGDDSGHSADGRTAPLGPFDGVASGATRASPPLRNRCGTCGNAATMPNEPWAIRRWTRRGRDYRVAGSRVRRRGGQVGAMAQQTQRVSPSPGLRGSVGGHLDNHVGADLPSLIFCRQEPRLQAVRRSTSAGTRPPRRPPDHRQHGPPHHFKLGAAISAGDDDLGTLQRSGHGTDDHLDRGPGLDLHPVAPARLVPGRRAPRPR
jgi:hypothetical protein